MTYTKTKTRKRFEALAEHAVVRWGIGIGFVVVGILYVFQTNTVATKGYDVAALQGEIRILKQETRKLDAEIASHRSMASIQARLEGKGFVSAGQPTYVVAGASAVALR